MFLLSHSSTLQKGDFFFLSLTGTLAVRAAIVPRRIIHRHDLIIVGVSRVTAVLVDCLPTVEVFVGLRLRRHASIFVLLILNHKRLLVVVLLQDLSVALILAHSLHFPAASNEYLAQIVDLSLAALFKKIGLG